MEYRADIEQRLATGIIRYRWWFLALAPIIVITLAIGLKNLEFKTDYRVFFSEDNPQLQAFDRLEKTYTQDDNVVFLLIPEDGQVFTRDTLTAVEELTKMAWQLPYSLRVDSLTNFQHTEAVGDDLLVADLVKNASGLSDVEIRRIRDIALAESMLVGRIVPMDADVTIVNVTVQLPRIDDTREVPEVVAVARGMAREIRARYPHLDVRLSGITFMNNAFSEASLNDIKSLVPISFVVMVVALVLLLRGVTGTFATLLVIVMSILAGMGVGCYFGLPITPPSSVSPIIILTMAIANSVHILVVFYHRLGAGEGRRAAMRESLRINLQPIFLTSLTTVIGFLTINLSEVPPFRDLANFVAVGVTASFLLSVTFLPALMTLLPARARRIKVDSHIMDGLADFVIHHRGWLLWGMGGVVIVLLAFIPRNELNDVYVHYFDEDIAFRRDADLLDEYLGGLYSIDYSLDSGESNGIHDPVFLGKVEAFAGWLRQQPEVVHVNTITDIFKRLNKNLHGDAPDWYRLPDEQTMAAQFLLLYEMSLPYGLDLNNQVNVDKSATRVRVSTRVLSTRNVLALEGRAYQWLAENALDLVTEGTGPTIMFSYIGQRNIRTMLKATSIALVLISLILIVTLHSMKIGLTSMVPNLVPAGMAFGIWGMVVGEVGLALSIITAMTIGIVVDDTIHFLSKYLRARREQGASSEDAVRYAFSHVGIALTITSFALIAGFLVLTLSSFYLNSSMGAMTALVLFLALVADFLFLPPLLMKLESSKTERSIHIPN
uniref:SSD domain-containing protein n=1 Tax=Candidatus Kentrum eta TaxID=2126337 RepID=A0A450UEI7_9GAMM|nr:MAG: hypothetical protein BECKH772A_GA0070896_1002425 [Candidatus Kentron sp. H]VFJ91899.1 MAG: hypothetical protein BECKH772B_GA0070898_1002223 [Candidatus Kentron sp. H]VFJ98564.1 MAG: hypothetical protein BECKH772C_GA0070978_1002224 [Candidatus Kentron sp. H]